MAGKLGLGVYSRHLDAIADLKASEATIGFLFGDALWFAADVKAAAPAMTIIGRDYRSVEEQDYMLSLPDGVMEHTFFTWGEWLARTFPAVDVWQDLNETYWPCAYDRLQRLVRAIRAFGQGTMQHGKPVAALSIATGAYPVIYEVKPERRGEMERFANIVGPLLEDPAVRFVSLHCYGSPRTQRMRDDPDWYALRYRGLYEGLRHYGVRRIPQFVILEYGQPDGWRPFMSADDAAADLEWFGERLQEDDYVAGSAYFLDGTIDDKQWGRFDIRSTNIPGRLRDWNRAHPANIAAPSVPTGGVTMPVFEYILGFRHYAAKHPDVGKPTSDLLHLMAAPEHDKEHPVAVLLQFSENGLFTWTATSGVQFFRAARH